MSFPIASLPLSGGTLAISPLPGRGGSYAADLASLLAFSPALVVTMTTGEELAANVAARLPDDLAANGIRWRHLPIADFGTPDAQTDARWAETADLARQGLTDGKLVLIHCMGGCGRSGMAALRLMVEAGEDPATALARLRAERPCAVETEAQFRWAAAGRPGR